MKNVAHTQDKRTAGFPAWVLPVIMPPPPHHAIGDYCTSLSTSDPPSPFTGLLTVPQSYEIKLDVSISSSAWRHLTAAAAMRRI